MNKDVHDLVLSILSESLPEGAPLTPATRFSDLSFDSLSLLEAPYTLEDRLSITVEIGDIETLECIGDLTAEVSRQRHPPKFTVV